MKKEKVIIPPKSEWDTMSLAQLYDTKSKLSDKYYAMRGIDASFANQFLMFMNEIDMRIYVLENPIIEETDSEEEEED